MNIKFSKYSKRHEDSVLLRSPYPGNARMCPPQAHEGHFDHAPPNIEVLSRAKRTPSIPKMELYSNRPALIKEVEHPDLNHYQSAEFMTRQYSIKGVGGLSFEKRPAKEFHAPPKPFRVPDGYEQSRLEKGYQIALNEKVKGKVDFGSQVPRDNAMYPKMDKDDLIAMQKRLGKREFKFSDYIPNSMKVKRPGSRTSLASTMVGTTAS
jgi:hypothetical protein